MADKSIVVKVNPKDIVKWANEGKKLVFQPEAEEGIIKLLDLKSRVEQALDMVARAIQQAGEAVMPGFKGVDGERVRVMYRYYGSKFEVVDAQAAAPFLKQVVISRLDNKKVEEYIAEHGDLPAGIWMKDRQKKLSISLKKVKSKEVK